jgi:tetratricopeptide (TPR) repeat protein
MTVWRLVLEDDDADVVASVRDGTINAATCEVCGSYGWITTPLLWVDRARQRAVFVSGGVVRDDEAAHQRATLLADALSGVSAEVNETIRRRVQNVRDHRDLPEALAVDDRVAEMTEAALQAVELRADLALSERLEQMVERLVTDGFIGMVQEEVTPEMLALIVSELSKIGVDDAPRADVLRFLRDRLAEYLEAHPPTKTERFIVEVPEFAEVAALGEAVPHADRESVVDARIDRLLQAAETGSATISDFDCEPAVLSRLYERIEDSAGDEAQQKRLRRLLAELLPAAASAERGDPTPDSRSQSTAGSSADDLRSAAIGHINAGEWHSAISATARLRAQAAEQRDDVLLSEAIALCGRAYFGLGDSLAALRYLQYAADHIDRILRARGGAADASTGALIAHVSEWLGDASASSGDLPRARAFYRHAKDVYERLGRIDGVETCLRALAQLAFAVGDFAGARALLESVLASCSVRGGRDAATAHINIANLLSNVQEVPRSVLELCYSTSAADAQNESPVDAALVDDRDDAVVISPALETLVEGDIPPGTDLRRLIFRVSIRREDSLPVPWFETIKGDEAVEHLTVGFSIAKEIGDVPLELSALKLFANLYVTYGMLTAAESAFRLLMKRLDHLHLSPGREVLASLALLWEKIARERVDQADAGAVRSALQKAFVHAEAALNAVVDTEQDRRAPAVLSSELTVRATLATTAEALGRHEEAREQYRAAIGLYEGSRQYLSEEQHKRHVQSRYAFLYVRAARNATALLDADHGRLELAIEAYGAVEAGRSRILLDSLHMPVEPGDAPTDPGEVARPMSVAAVAAALPADTALIQYALLPAYQLCPGSWRLFTILPTRGLLGVPLRRDLEEMLAARDRLRTCIDAMSGQLKNESRPYELWAHDEFRSGMGPHLEELGEMLLPNELLERLRCEGIRRLVIVPDAYLFDVPFAALRISAGPRTQYVIVDSDTAVGFEVVVAASASTALGGGPVNGNPAPVRPRLLCVSDPQLNLAPVSSWLDEVIDEVWPAAWPSRHLKGSEARSGPVLEALGECDTMLFFGHATHDPSDGRLSGIALNDGLLSTARLMAGRAAEQRWACKICVLIACSGASVDALTERDVRELLGTSAALHYRGVKGVVASLWSLWMPPAAEFARSLLSALAGGVKLSAAVRAAQEDMKASWPDPYFWGGITASGDGDQRLAYAGSVEPGE